ncbi:YezD family protein [Paenibacillus ginsengarvi]|uniref:DUF2292 domain-containing protein n=1 Tax=Paenibacillus ginsengarvi TaxID=400777 RepID=A0A3B0CN81_9BACL|nr:YezD family protein [Paenibacillus ginsengarvi]RKN85406.1 DUF2292 domain-containing protein [Paenibacillus ginsengarvi]
MGNGVQLDETWTKRILDTVKGMEYGNVNIIVHAGKIVQIERTERKRFDTPALSPVRNPSGTLQKRG